MATKAQTKAVIDAVVVQIKFDMDNYIPSSANYTDGHISFNPNGWGIQFNLGGNFANAIAFRDSIVTALTNASISHRVKNAFGRREDDQSEDVKFIRIDVLTAPTRSFIIRNIGTVI